MSEEPLPPATPTYLEAFDRLLGAKTVIERERAEEDMAEILPHLMPIEDLE